MTIISYEQMLENVLAPGQTVGDNTELMALMWMGISPGVVGGIGSDRCINGLLSNVPPPPTESASPS